MNRTTAWLRALAPVLGLSLLFSGQAHAAACTNSQKVAAKITQAGFNNTVFQEGGSVGLDVNTGGSTPNSQPPALFSWSQVSGPAVTFSPATGAHTSFTVPHIVAGHAAQIVVKLTVTRTDCTGAGSAEDTVTINLANINNFPPVAIASSSPATVNPNTLVSLRSTGSYDPDNDPISFAWTQVPLAGVPTVTLTGANTPTATFVAPSVAATTTFRFRLTVTEAVASALTGTTTTDVNVVISNQPPVASLACPSDVNEGATITLNGSGSTDPESGALTYVFSQTSGFPLATIPPLPHGSSVSFPAPALGLGQPGNVQFGLTVTDPANASNSKTCTVFIHDVTSPVLAGATNQALEATSAAGAVGSYSVTWTDNVDGGPNPATCVPVSGTTFGFGTTTVNCSAQDSAHNTGTASFTVTVADSIAPVIAAHANVTEEATSAAGAISNYTLPATSDAVDGAGTATCTPAPGSQFALGTTPVACNATDAHGNAATPTGFDVIVQDTTAPAITAPANVSAEATGPLTVVAHGVATATDAVGPITYSDDAPASFPVGTTTIHWGAKDGAGNTSSTTSTVTVGDSTAPTVTDNADLVIEATSAAGAVATFPTPTASDLVDGSLAVTCDATSGATFAITTTTVTCSATDSHGNSGSSSFTITVQDTTPPAIGNVADVIAEATGPTGASVLYISPMAIDAVDGTIPTSCSPASGSVFGLGDTTVTCSVTDAHSNSASKTFNVKVQDTTPPTVTVPGNISTEATGPAGAAASFSASASDLVDGTVATTCTPVSGSTFALGTTTVICTATDAHSNTGSNNFTVTVVDTTPPVVTVPADMTKEATGPSGAVATFTSTASDIVDGSVATTCLPASGSTFAIGTTLVTCSATDAHSNTGTASFNVTVQDTTPPTVTVPANISAEATGPSGAAVSFSTSASDIVDGVVATTCSPASGATFGLGTTTVNCSATDTHGNTGHGSFTVTVVDTTPPDVTVPGDITKEATGPSGAVATFASSASDLVDGAVATTCVPASGSTFAIGNNLVSCSATDAAGNTGTATFHVLVQDTTPPVVTVPANYTTEADGPAGTAVVFTSSAFDLVDGSLPTNCAPASGSTFGIGTTTVACTATDSHGNTGSNSFSVTVQDTTPPTVTVPGTITKEATGPSGAVATFTSTASDIVDGSVATTCLPASGSTFAIGTTLVTCSATDAHSNTGTASFNVIVQDTTPPSVASHADVTVEATGAAGAIATFTNPTASDIVDGPVSVDCLPASGSLFAVGDTAVTCKAIDAHGNTGSNGFTVHVVDTTPPVLGGHGDVTIEATGPAGANVGYTAPTASDLVDGSVAVSCLPASGSTFAVGNTTVNCTATDSHGNSSHGSFAVHVIDTTAPMVANHGDVTVEATSAAGAIASFTKPTASDLVDGSVAVTCAPASGSQFALGNTSVTCSATDAHGNTGSNGFTVHVVDTTGPAIAAHADVTAIATSGAGAIVTYTVPTASDLVDGTVAVTCLPASGSQFALGSTTVTCTATDSHGNTSHSTFKVIVSFNFTGFFKPVDNLPVINVVKAGQAIPVKFSLGGNMGLAIFAAGYPASGSIACTTGPVDAVEETVTAGGSSLSYDATAGQYIYVWKTDKAWAASCRQLVVKFADGSSAKVANFNFTR